MRSDDRWTRKNIILVQLESACYIFTSLFARRRTQSNPIRRRDLFGNVSHRTVGIYRNLSPQSKMPQPLTRSLHGVVIPYVPRLRRGFAWSSHIVHCAHDRRVTPFTIVEFRSAMVYYYRETYYVRERVARIVAKWFTHDPYRLSDTHRYGRAHERRKGTAHIIAVRVHSYRYDE